MNLNIYDEFMVLKNFTIHQGMNIPPTTTVPFSTTTSGRALSASDLSIVETICENSSSVVLNEVMLHSN